MRATYYEIIITEKNQVSNYSADTILELSNLVRAAQGKKYKVYRVHRSPTGNVSSTEELKCHVSGNSIVINTVKTKPFIPRPKKPKYIPKKQDPRISKSKSPAVEKKPLRYEEINKILPHTLRDSDISTTSAPVSKRVLSKIPKVINRGVKQNDGENANKILPHSLRGADSPNTVTTIPKRALSKTPKIIGRGSKQKSSNISRSSLKSAGVSRSSKSSRRV